MVIYQAGHHRSLESGSSLFSLSTVKRVAEALGAELDIVGPKTNPQYMLSLEAICGSNLPTVASITT